MHFVRKGSVPFRVMLVTLVAILLSWVLSSTTSYLFMCRDMMALRREMLARPDLYPMPINEPRFSFIEMLFGAPQGMPHDLLPRPNDAPPPPRDMNRQAPPPQRPTSPPPQRPPVIDWRGLLIRGLTALTLAVLAGVALHYWVTRPLRALAKGVAAYRAGFFTYRIPITGEGDFAQVASVMHGMAAQVSSQLSQLEEDAKRRQHLLADVAHELRAPTMTIRTMSGALARGLADDPTRRQYAIAALERTSDHMLHLITDLLELARLDLKQLPLHPQLFDLHEVVTTVLQQQSVAAQEASITLYADAGDVPVMVLADPDRITQVLGNLVSNAIAYAGAGTTVHVSVAEETTHVTLRVADTGAGIPASHLPYLFDAFYRADTVRSPKDKHCGLGLRITRGLVEAHGGTLDLQSAEGLGTTITIRLPKRPPQNVLPVSESTAEVAIDAT